MADTHGDDPNVAPTHSEVREQFAFASYVIATILGLGAVAAGIAFGIIQAND